MNAVSRTLGIVLTGFMLMALESPLLQELHLSFFAPDLALIVVVWVLLNMETTSGGITCVLLGFLKDGFTMVVPVGMHMEIFIVLFLIGRFFSGRVQVRGLVGLIVTTALASVLASMLFALLSLLFDRTFGEFDLIVKLMLPYAAVTAPFAPLIFYLLDRVDRLFHRKSGDSIFFS